MKIEPKLQKIFYGEREICFSLRRNSRKHLKIVVTPDLAVEVVAPLDASEAQVLSALHKKARWIVQKLDKLASYHPLPTARQYISGETLVYLGRQYRLRVEAGRKATAKLRGRHLMVMVADPSDRASVKLAVERWYKGRSRHIIDRHLEKCLAVTRRHGLPEPKPMIRNMKRRWGSCSPAGRITLNLKLVQVPVHCIEYVIMHELCHLKHPNHSRAFFNFLTRCQPDWRSRKAALDRFRLS